MWYNGKKKRPGCIRSPGIYLTTFYENGLRLNLIALSKKSDSAEYPSQTAYVLYHVPQRDDDTGMDILRGSGVEVFIDRNEADAADTEILLYVVASVNGVSAQTGEVFHNDAVDVTGLNIREHLLKARTVEVCPRRAVVDVGIVHADLRVLLQIAGNNHLLGFNGYAVRVGIPKEATHQSELQQAANVLDALLKF